MTVSEKSLTTPERDRQRPVTVTSFENSMNHVNGRGNEEEDMEIVKESECLVHLCSTVEIVIGA